VFPPFKNFPQKLSKGPVMSRKTKFGYAFAHSALGYYITQFPRCKGKFAIFLYLYCGRKQAMLLSVGEQKVTKESLTRLREKILAYAKSSVRRLLFYEGPFKSCFLLQFGAVQLSIWCISHFACRSCCGVPMLFCP